ncbi:hypothetical protein [Streptomyces sp. NPDC002526]
MYSLAPGYRVPAIQRGLAPAETLLTKLNGGAGAAVLMSALISPPPIAAFGAVAAAAAVLNLAPGPRSIGRWAAVGARHLIERTTPARALSRTGQTATWALYPAHGTMQDAHRRAMFHEGFARALDFAGGQARGAGIQVHVTHHGTPGEYSAHAQTVSVHVPRGLVGYPGRVIDTIAGEFAALGDLTPVDPDPLHAVVQRTAGWVELDTGRYASTARITAWPEESAGDLMPRLLLGHDGDRSLSVLYRPLPAAQSHRSAKWQSAAASAFTQDKVRQDAHAMAGQAVHGALVQGATLVDVDAYLTVWGDSPEAVTEARWQTALSADRHRMRLDWLPGQQHRAHVMTTAHGAATGKGMVL